MIGGSSPGIGWEFFTTASRSALGLTQLPIQRVPGALSRGVKRLGREMTPHLHQVPRQRMRGAVPLLHQYAFMAWCSVEAQGQIYLYLYVTGHKLITSLVPMSLFTS